jgi:hypothetical protein
MHTHKYSVDNDEMLYQLLTLFIIFRGKRIMYNEMERMSGGKGYSLSQVTVLVVIC